MTLEQPFELTKKEQDRKPYSEPDCYTGPKIDYGGDDHYRPYGFRHSPPRKDPNESFSQTIIEKIKRAIKVSPKWPTNPVIAVAKIQEEIGEIQESVREIVNGAENKNTRNDLRFRASELVTQALRFQLSVEYYKYDLPKEHSQEQIKLDSGGILITTRKMKNEKSIYPENNK